MFNYFKISKFFLYVIPLGVVIVSTSTLFPFIVGKYVFFRIAVDLALIFYLLGLLFQDKLSEMSRRLLSVFKKPLVIAVSVFVLIFLLACFFGVDPKMSFWSNFERGEGGLQLLHLWVFFMLLVALFREEKDWQRLFVIAIIGGLGMAFYGFLAGVGAQNVIGPKFSDTGFRFQGSIGNPAYVAAYAIFMLFYTGYLLLQRRGTTQTETRNYADKQAELRGQTSGTTRKSPYKSAVLWFLMAVFIAVFFAAATRGAFLGLFAALMVLIGYNIFYAGRKWRIRLVAATVIILLAVGLLIQFRNVPLIKAIPGSRIFDISFSAETFQTRFIMWGVALKGWQERPIFGWGPENFLQVFEKHFNLDYVRAVKGQYFEWYDRAHSIYFDYLAETGALGLLSFLGIFVVFYWQFFKTRMNTDKNTDEHRLENIRVNPLSHPRESVLIKGLLFALPIAYLVQGIVLFDVLPIYMNIFLFLAFASYYFNKTSNPNR